MVGVNLIRIWCTVSSLDTIAKYLQIKSYFVKIKKNSFLGLRIKVLFKHNLTRPNLDLNYTFGVNWFKIRFSVLDTRAGYYRHMDIFYFKTVIFT